MEGVKDRYSSKTEGEMNGYIITYFIQSLEKQEAPKNSSLFSDVLESLPSTLPNEVMKNVNVPFAFICLLHLANEKGLEISQEKDNLTELFIQIPEK